MSRRDHRRKIITLLLIGCGILILLYPVVSTQWNNHKQMEVAREYERILDNIPAERKAKDLRRAREYNRTKHFTGPILDPWLARISPDNTDYNEYLSQLNAADVMARLRIPAIKVDLPIRHGTAPQTLENSVGHLFGSDLPVGGKNTHAILTGHTGLANATLFDNLTDLKENDAFYITVYGETLKYQVISREVVEPSETGKLGVVPGKDLVTLVTCTPYGINSHRLLVTGTRVPMDPSDNQELEKASQLQWQWWMIAILAGVGLLILLLPWLLRRAWKKSGKEPGKEGNAP